MEGFEHGNKDMGAIMRNQVVVGGKAGREGGQHHFVSQALVLRRATTNARRNDCVVNKCSQSQRADVDVEDPDYKRKIDTTDAMLLLVKLKDEFAKDAQCETCEPEEALERMQNLEVN